MTSIIKLTTFSGASENEPHCYLLQIDDFRFLLDCGWDEQFNFRTIDLLKKHVHQIDAILLSHPDPYHLGTLPYLVGKLGLNCPIYATIPIFKMGQMFMYDLYQSRHNNEEFNLFTLDDVDAAFDKIIQLKYLQTINLKGKGQGLQITPLPAGHLIGGALWKIVKEGEEAIVYCVDYNHKKERHLNGCMLEGISRPHLLITDVFNADCVQSRRMLRDEQLLNIILKTVRNDGNVLITIDTAGRVLELAQLLDQMWKNQESGLSAYSLCMLSNVAYNVVEFAKSQVEWMSDKIMKTFEDFHTNPFQFKFVHLCHSMAELSRVMEPKVVLASVAGMECGYSRELFIQWCGNPNNCIILTSRSSAGTLNQHLIENPHQKIITLDVKERVSLNEYELEEFKSSQKLKEFEQQKLKVELNKKIKEEVDELSDSDTENTMGDLTPHIKIKHDLLLKLENKPKTGFFKQVTKTYPMFPAREEKIKWDDYGELIRPEDFLSNDPAATEEEIIEVEEAPPEIKAPVSSQPTEIPRKCISRVEALNILAGVVYIDFEGRSDGESVKKIIHQIKPRQLILVRGSDSNKEKIIEYCKSSISKIFTPQVNETVDATTESHIYQVRLKDAIVCSLKFHKAKDIEIAWIDAMLNVNRSLIKNQDVDDFQEEIPTLASLPPHTAPAHTAVFVNNPRLSELKQMLSTNGFKAEMSGGILICNNVVAVRRNESGKMQIEGTLCPDYYKIRQLIYQQFAII